jgi:hypothetical protein
MVCGTGNWRLLAIALILVALLLTFGGPIERGLRRARGESDDDAPPADGVGTR